MMLKCPICKKEVAAESADFPFCSARCRLIDLGKWATEEYRISTPANSQKLPEEEDD